MGLYCDACVLCDGEVEVEVEVEDINHLFFRCQFSKAIWSEVRKRNGLCNDAGCWSFEGLTAIREIKGGVLVADYAVQLWLLLCIRFGKKVMFVISK